MSIKNQIPNSITCGNLFCGCVATVYALNGNLIFTAYLVGIAAVLDFLDGFAARLLKVHSEMGKQLDSLADMVTFGLVPGIVLFMMISNATGYIHLNLMDESQGIYASKLYNDIFPYWIAYVAFSITIFSAIRLAKFNIDTRQTDSFIGVPTPAASILICSLPLITKFQTNIGEYHITEFIENPWVLIGLAILISYLLVAEIPLFALKFKTFSWVDNKTRYTFLILSSILLILFKFIAIPFILFLYVVLSLIVNRSVASSE